MNSKVIITFIIFYFVFYYSYGQNTIPTRDYEVNIENETVRQYMQDAVYEPHDSSLIDNYRQGITYRTDWPNPVVMYVPQTTVDSLFIYCCDDETLQDSLTFHVSSANSSVELYNFIPNRVYRYQIKNDQEVLQEGKIRTSGQLRMINVCNTVSNVRDLGGWKTADNMQVRYGKIFRGTELNGTYHATAEGIRILRELGVGAELDMRAKYNEGYGTSVFGFSGFSSTKVTPTYYYTSDSGQLPSDLTNSTWLTKWRLEFEFIVKNLRESRAIYEHCVHGKDRTGFLSFFLEGLLGMSYSDLVKEYELTYFSNNLSSTKDSIDKVFEYIDTMSGETLCDKFYTFFVDKLRAKQNDIEYFRSEMLEATRPEDNAIRDTQNDVISEDNILYDLNGRRVRVAKSGRLYLMKDRYGHTKKVIVQ
jgi:hypothetical protein